MCSLAGLSISGRERMSLREDVSSAGDSMALEERGQTPGAAWQTSSDTRPHCRRRTSSLWFGPTACRTARELELGRCHNRSYRQETDRDRRRGRTERRAPTGAKPKRARNRRLPGHAEAPQRAREPVMARARASPAFFPQTSKPTICTFKCRLAHQITETIKAFLLPFTAPPSSTVPCRFVFPLPL